MLYYINPSNIDPKTGMLRLSWVTVIFDKFYGYFDSNTGEAVILDVSVSIENKSVKEDEEYILKELEKLLVKGTDQDPPHIALKFF